MGTQKSTSRRAVLAGALLTSGSSILASSVAPSARADSSSSPVAQPTSPASTPKGPFTLPELGYAYADMEPVIDTQTMTLHHSKHHQAAVTALNAAVAAAPMLVGRGLETLLSIASQLDVVVRNNAGSHYNHSLYWRMMSPPGKGGAPSAELSAQINQDFGSMDAFKAAFQSAGVSRYGSGWAWLVWNGSELKVISLPYQDNPLMDDVSLRGSPILLNDVWEHAYYLKWQNRRDAYLSNWWQVTNWTEASRLFADATRQIDHASWRAN